MAAKRESVAKCAGPLQYCVRRPHGANIVIKTIQHLAEADPTRVLFALDLNAAFQNVSRRGMLHRIVQSDPDLAAVFSKWYTGATEHRMHFEPSHTKIAANSGVYQGCPLSTCGFSTAIDPVLRYVLADICILPSLQQLPDQSTLSSSPPRFRCGEHLAQNLHDKVKLSLSCLGGHLRIQGDVEASPIVLGEQASMEKTTQRFRRIASTLAELNAEGLSAQTVNDLLPCMWVQLASTCPARALCRNTKPGRLTQRSLLSGHNSSSLMRPLLCSFYLSRWEDLV